MNYMKQVAQMLGVDLGEEFTINDSYNSIYKFTNNGLFWRCQGHWLPSDITFIKILCGKAEIIKKHILDKAEKEYLGNIVKPFRKCSISIYKATAFNGQFEYITICVNNEVIKFPCYDRDTMYKGMEVYKRYSLEDLGL